MQPKETLMKTVHKQAKRIVLSILLFAVLFSVTACLPGDGKATVASPAHFLWGVWHGWLAPLSLVISIFDDNIRIYEVLNTGFWYDLGFYMAIISGFGGLSLARRKNRRDG